MDVSAATTLVGMLDREVWLVTARIGPRQGGLIATWVNSASLVAELPRMTISISHYHHTWTLIEASQAFALHLLGEQHLPWISRFGLQSGRDIDKFADVETIQSQSGSPILNDALGWFDCRVETSMDIGDRTIYLAQVLESQVTNLGSPLTQKRLAQLAPAHLLSEMKRQAQQEMTQITEWIHAWRQHRGLEQPDPT
jgi:flavin reductase (DIM6/NTAB) family NADH-FMN oxidoreductase RutF